jgi:hypothetical protein
VAPSSHHLTGASAPVGRGAPVISGTVGVEGQQGGASQGYAAEGPRQFLGEIRRGDGWLGEKLLPATRGAPGQQLGRTRNRDFAGGTGRAGCLNAGRSVAGRFISGSSPAAATGVTTVAANTYSGVQSVVREQSLLSSGAATASDRRRSCE